MLERAFKNKICVLQYMKVFLLIDRADETLGCVCLSWSTVDEIDLSLARGTGISEQGSLAVRKRFGTERLPSK